MSGRRLTALLLGAVAVFAAALVWFQYFAFYERTDGLARLPVEGLAVPVAGWRGIDAGSSPLKLRGCFTLDPGALAGLPAAETPTPLTPPPWFRCFDAGALTRDLAAGEARAVMLAQDRPSGFDTLAAVYPDGRGYVWRQLNDRYAD